MTITISESLATSPFIELGCPFTLYEALKTLILLPFVPFRIALGGFSLLLVAIVNSVAVWNWPLERPLPPWRRRIVLLSKEFITITLWCLGFRIQVKGADNISLGQRLGAVGIFNHVSWVDAFVMVWLMAPSGVSKADNAHIPIIGTAVRALQNIYIPYEKLSRRRGTSSPTSAGTTSSAPTASPAGQEALAPAAAAGVTAAEAVTSDAAPWDSCSAANGSYGLGASYGTPNGSQGCPIVADPVGCSASAATASARSASPSPTSSSSTAGASSPSRAPPIVAARVTEALLRRVRDPGYCRPGGFPMLAMAPEGTTGNGRALLQFRTGAFSLGRPVLPICLRYRWRGLNPAWTIGDVRWHFIRLMCQFRNDLEVEILPPYRPSQEELTDPKLYAAHVRRLMASCLGVPLVEASHDDYLQLRTMGVGVSWDGRRVVVSATAPSASASPPASAAS